jgi:hypothetical protein
MSPSPEKLAVLVGYNCDVCHGKMIVETEGTILHFCEGWLIPVYEVVEVEQ